MYLYHVNLGFPMVDASAELIIPATEQRRALGEGNYVVGLEPSTNSTAGRLAARDQGQLDFLEAGEERTHQLVFDLASDADQQRSNS